MRKYQDLIYYLNINKENKYSAQKCVLTTAKVSTYTVGSLVRVFPHHVVFTPSLKN